MSTVEGDEWKELRSTFSPIFTSGKMKGMMVLINEVTKNLLTEVEELTQKGRVDAVDMKELFGKFSMDTIASCAFGVDAQSFKENKTLPFAENAGNVFKRGPFDLLKFLIMMVLPFTKNIFSMLGISFMKKKETLFFRDIVRQTLRERLSGQQQKRNDLIDLMISAIKDDHKSENTADEPEDQFEKVMFWLL